VIRRSVPWTILPLALLASVLASMPWRRAFPSDIITVPLIGAALVSVLVAYVVVRLGIRALWLSALIDVAAFVLYTLFVVLHEPFGFPDLVSGIFHGPSQVLTFALPLVSPRSLLVAPVALCWLAGAIGGECLARQWSTAVPYGAWLVTFGLGYAGSVRAASGTAHDLRVSDTVSALSLFLVLMLLRVAQSWVRQEAGAESTQADGVLPLRGLVIGTGTALVVGLVAAVVVQSSAFAGRTTTPQRVPPVSRSQPLSPVAFIGDLRPTKPTDPAQPVFHVTVDRTSPAYFGIANVDYYDGDGWGFTRSFRPSGGIVPDDTDPALNVHRPAVTQRYRIVAGPLTASPWMPFLYRPQRVTSTTVNIDAASGMVVPSTRLRDGQTYTIRSDAPTTSFTDLPSTGLPATSAPPIDTQIPGALRTTLATVVNTFAAETGTSSSSPLPFLQALSKDLQTKYALVGKPRPGASTSPTPSPSKTKPGKKHRRPKPKPTATATPHAGGVSFTDVLASIVGPQRAATPEQYATLFALVARQLGVPARVVTGFRARSDQGGHPLAAGGYTVTTGDAWTWVEIPIRGVGWVVADPAPSSFSSATRTPTAAAQPSQTPTATPTRNALITQSNGGHAVAPKSKLPHNGGATNRPLIIALLVLAAILVIALLLALLLRKQIRARRRRRAPDPRRRLLGAWHESLDVLTESGLPDLTNLTSGEIVLATGERFGDEPASQAAFLGRAANAVVYSAATRVGPAEADAAWNAHSTLRRLVRRHLSVGGRLAAGLRYHRSKTPRAVPAPASWATPPPAPKRRGPGRLRRHNGNHRAH
jgi:transglutaminase superfamily protein